jgi:hypothetical protein
MAYPRVRYPALHAPPAAVYNEGQKTTLTGDFMTRRILFLTLIAALLLTALSACSSSAAQAGHGEMKMAPLHEMPAEVQRASVTTQQAYQFAVANPEITQGIPCYCGCGDMGHTSNYACYVQRTEDGKIIYDQHALGCSICVDITQDAMRMMGEGKTLAQIKSAIDDTYSRYGPSNME